MTTSKIPHSNSSAHVVLPGLANVARLSLRKSTSGDADADASLVELFSACTPSRDVQHYLLQVAFGATGLFASLIALSLLAAKFVNTPLITFPVWMRHIALVGSALMMISIGLVVTVTVRAAVVAAVWGASATLVMMIAIALSSLRQDSFIHTELFTTIVPSILPGAGCASGLGAAAATLTAMPMPPRNSRRRGREALADVLDAIAAVAILALLGAALVGVGAMALDQFVSSGAMTELVYSAAGLLVGAPFLLAAWRRRVASGSEAQATNVVIKMTSILSALGVIAATAAHDPNASATLPYGIGIGMLVGGLAGGLFALVWQWTDRWEPNGRAIAAIALPVMLISALVWGRLFNEHYNRERPALTVSVTAAAVLGYALFHLVSRRTAR
jgi:hypothetical protein